MTMKLSKTFLTGILVFALVFGMTLAGCDNGSTGDDNNGGGNSLLGSWVDDRTNPTEAIIFTNVNDDAISGAKVAYYSANLTKLNNPAQGGQVTINGTAYQYTLGDNTLTLDDYGTDAQGNPADVLFNRAKGTSGSTIHGIWVSALASTDPKYTLLIIRSSSAITFISVGQANWGVAAYTLNEDRNSTQIKWGNGSYNPYTRNTNPDQLDVNTPNNQMLNGLWLLSAW
jgi:hypothetical protein